MLLVGGTVDILSIPACWEGNGCADATTALLLGEVKGIITSAWCSAEWILLLVAEAAMADLLLHSCLGSEPSITDEHAESLGESCDLCLAIVRGNIVNCDSFSA